MMTGLLIFGVLSLFIFGIMLVAAAAALPPQRLGRARCRPEEKSIALLRSWLSPEQLKQWTTMPQATCRYQEINRGFSTPFRKQ